MVSTNVVYCKGYKQQLRADFHFVTPVKPAHSIITELVHLHPNGYLLVKKYFAWDGCSGLTRDDRTNTRSCLIHDAFYYLFRQGLLDLIWQETVDDFLQQMIERDTALLIEYYKEAMEFWKERWYRFLQKLNRGWYYKICVRLLGRRCALTSSAREIFVAPIPKR